MNKTITKQTNKAKAKQTNQPLVKKIFATSSKQKTDDSFIVELPPPKKCFECWEDLNDYNISSDNENLCVPCSAELNSKQCYNCEQFESISCFKTSNSVICNKCYNLEPLMNPNVWDEGLVSRTIHRLLVSSELATNVRECGKKKMAIQNEIDRFNHDILDLEAQKRHKINEAREKQLITDYESRLKNVQRNDKGKIISAEYVGYQDAEEPDNEDQTDYDDAVYFDHDPDYSDQDYDQDYDHDSEEVYDDSVATVVKSFNERITKLQNKIAKMQATISDLDSQKKTSDISAESIHEARVYLNELIHSGKFSRDQIIDKLGFDIPESDKFNVVGAYIRDCVRKELDNYFRLFGIRSEALYKLERKIRKGLDRSILDLRPEINPIAAFVRHRIVIEYIEPSADSDSDNEDSKEPQPRIINKKKYVKAKALFEAYEQFLEEFEINETAEVTKFGIEITKLLEPMGVTKKDLNGSRVYRGMSLKEHS